MRLELASFPVRQAAFGESTRLERETLTIRREELIDLLAGDPAFASVDVALVRPGENVRISQISDAIEPRIKVDGPGQVFPGILGPIETVGSGRTNRLANVAVLTTGEVPWLGANGLFVPRDSFLDMIGPASGFTPHSKTINVVLRLSYAEGFTHEQYERALLLAGLKTARHLAQTTIGSEPTEVRVLGDGARGNATGDARHDMAGGQGTELPKVFYACQVQSQGIFMRTYLYGRPLDELLPTLLHPNELADGALVAGGLGGTNVKLSTWQLQNNPIVQQMRERDGQDWSFSGIILSRGHFYQYEDKERVAIQIAKLAEMSGANGVVFTLGGAGNNVTEVMLAIRACERAGIKTVLITWEHGGPKGNGYPLPFAVPEAEAIVSTGNLDEPFDIEPLPVIVGNTAIRVRPEVGGVRLPLDQPIHMERRAELYGAANPVGVLPTGSLEY